MNNVVKRLKFDEGTGYPVLTGVKLKDTPDINEIHLSECDSRRVSSLKRIISTAELSLNYEYISQDTMDKIKGIVELELDCAGPLNKE